jgi:hypothetical protein
LMALVHLGNSIGEIFGARQNHRFARNYQVRVDPARD